MTATYGTSEISPADANFVASKTSATLDADVNLAVSSLLAPVRNSVWTENLFTQNQITQSNHAPNTDFEQPIEVVYNNF